VESEEDKSRRKQEAAGRDAEAHRDTEGSEEEE
jgi:hypothetical protein